jgi:HAD superfamily 5'-nucleotidase-like hydrolase
MEVMPYHELRQRYRHTSIDLNEQRYLSIDTAFSIGVSTLIMQLIQEKDRGMVLPEDPILIRDVFSALDAIHADGTLKSLVQEHLGHYIQTDPEMVAGLERFKKAGKHLIIITNSDFHYSKALLDFAINPYLKDHQNWQELFPWIILLAQKPRFFSDRLPFLQVDPGTGALHNFYGKLKPGIYQGGNAQKLQQDLNLAPDELLYLGDHIYGDILKLKTTCAWRTGLVIEELQEELSRDRELLAKTLQIRTKMSQKENLEEQRNLLDLDQDAGAQNRRKEIQVQIEQIDRFLQPLLQETKAHFNLLWGPFMRSGNRQSYYAYQVTRYSDLYMGKVGDLLLGSPNAYYRAPRLPLPHELSLEAESEQSSAVKNAGEKG